MASKDNRGEMSIANENSKHKRLDEFIFRINYIIGSLGIFLGLYNWKRKCILCGCSQHWIFGCKNHREGKHEKENISKKR